MNDKELMQQQIPNCFFTKSHEDAFAFLAVLLRNDYECSISVDCEGVFMIYYDRPQYGGCRVEWIDPNTQEVVDFEEV